MSLDNTYIYFLQQCSPGPDLASRIGEGHPLPGPDLTAADLGLQLLVALVRVRWEDGRWVSGMCTNTPA